MTTAARSLHQAKLKVRKIAAKARERLFFELLDRAGLPRPVTELEFAIPDREWRFDYSWPEYKLALEIEGGIWGRIDPRTGEWTRQPGRHRTGNGLLEDMAKYNRAAVLGWRLLRVQPVELATLTTVGLIRSALLAHA